MEGTTVSLPCNGVVTCVECSPFEDCDSLLCYTSHVNSDTGQASHHITIAKLHHNNQEDKMLEILKEFQQDRLVTCLSWSPRTYVECLPYEVVICAGSIDGQVSLITTDLKDSSSVQTLGIHGKAVNAASFDCDGGELLASVGDDHKCFIWNTLTGAEHHQFPLKSAGVDVRFNQQDYTKLAVAEKLGIIKFYDMTSLTLFLSVETGGAGLLKSIDWSVQDIARIDALSGLEWLTFDTFTSCLPVSAKSLSQHGDIAKCGRRLRMSPSNSSLVAVSCGGANNIAVIGSSSTTKSDELLHQIPRFLGSGFSWLLSEAVLVCGGDSKLIIVRCNEIS